MLQTVILGVLVLIGIFFSDFIPLWLLLSLFVIFIIWEFNNKKETVLEFFKILKSEDLMKYPYYSRNILNYYKALSESKPIANKWQESLKDVFERSKNSDKGDKIELTYEEYSYLEEYSLEQAKSRDYQRAYREMIMDNLAIINGKKTFSQVEDREIDIDVFETGWLDERDRMLKKILKEKNWVYKEKS